MSVPDFVEQPLFTPFTVTALIKIFIKTRFLHFDHHHVHAEVSFCRRDIACRHKFTQILNKRAYILCDYDVVDKVAHIDCEQTLFCRRAGKS